jgi:hypothetical protein
LVKTHGKEYFEPIAKTLMDLGVKKPNFLNPKHLWALKGPMTKYGLWAVKQALFPKSNGNMYLMGDDKLARHAKWAAKQLQKSALQISSIMVKHQLGLVDRQCRMYNISDRVQKLVMIAVTSMYAYGKDETTEMAADVFCMQTRRELEGKGFTDAEYKKHMKLAKKIIDGDFKQIKGVKSEEILMKYEK